MLIRATRINPIQTRKRASYIAGCVIAATTIASALEYVPHTYLMDKYKKIVQMYRDGEPYPLKPKIKNLWDEVIQDLKFDEDKKNSLTPFTVVGFNLFHAGMEFSKLGAIIGIPVTFSYRDKYSFDLNSLQIYNQDLNEHHPAADDLLESLLLSDKAKKYGMAREILMTDKNIPLYHTVATPFIMTTTALSAEAIRIKLPLYNKTKLVQGIVYGMTALVGFAVWFQFRDIFYTYCESTVDEELLKLGPEYIEGGKEYYDKILKRNIALRALLGPEGPKKFNKDGNERFFFRQKQLPPSKRKQFFDSVQVNVENNNLSV